MFITCTFQLISSRESSEVSSFCPLDVTLIGLPYLSTRVLEGCGVSVSGSGVDVDSELD